MSNSVIFRNVTKKYKMYKKTSDKLLDILLPRDMAKIFLLCKIFPLLLVLEML